MFLPMLIYFIVFHYLPMYGVQIAFRDFLPSRGILGSQWVDEFYLDNIMAVEANFGPVGEKGEGKNAYVQDDNIIIVNPQGTMYTRGQQSLPFAPTIMRLKSGMPILKDVIALDYKRRRPEI